MEKEREPNEIRYLVAMEELKELSQTRRVCLCALSYWIQQKEKGRYVDDFIDRIRRQLREIRKIDIEMHKGVAGSFGGDINLLNFNLKK